MNVAAVEAGGGPVGVKAPTMPTRLLLPGQPPVAGGLSHVLISKGADDQIPAYTRPAVNDPVVVLSFNPDCGRTDHRGTRAFELYQRNRTVDTGALLSYHGCMHFQQPDQAQIMSTDTLITRIAGTVRTDSTATITLTHPRCIRTVTFPIGVKQRSKATWLLPLRECNAHQSHLVAPVDDLAADPECLECFAALDDRLVCKQCGTGRYGNVRVAVGDSITVGNTIVHHCHETNDPAHIGKTGVTYTATPLGRSNRHSQDISPE